MILPIQREEFAIPITAGDQPDLLAIADFYQTGTGGFWVAKADGPCSRNDRAEGYRQQKGRAAEDVRRDGLQGFATRNGQQSY